jgi:adenosine deaminase
VLTGPERLLRLPKAELHVHLDGSLRPNTMLELAEARDVPLPASTADELAVHMAVPGQTSLENYLERFDLTLAVLQDHEALERVAYELVVDHASENVRYVEVRFCPQLNTKRGLTAAEVVDAALEGLRRAEDGHDIQAALIVCALRSHDGVSSREMAELAVAYRSRGVVGFDLAGAEKGNPVRDHADAFRCAAEADLPITIHAGEGFGPASIREALELGHADRIGHGTRLHEDPELLGIVRDRGIPLEVCVTSNVQTGAAPSPDRHPLRDYFDGGINVCLSTDNRLVSGVTLVDEYRHARDALGFTWPELVTLARSGFEHAFVDDESRRTLLRRFDAEASTLA